MPLKVDGDNMQFLLGLLTAVVFFLCLAAAFYIGHRTKRKSSIPVPLTEEEKERQKEVKRYNQHFKALFSYDTEIALQRKKVT